jgi:hypothetical protein
MNETLFAVSTIHGAAFKYLGRILTNQNCMKKLRAE